MVKLLLNVGLFFSVLLEQNYFSSLSLFAPSMFDMAQVLKVTSAYIVISLLSLAAAVLLAITVHLVYTAKTKCKNATKNRQVLFMIVITLIGIMSFFITIILIILLLIQIILIDGHKLSETSFYYQSFEVIEYLIAIFDQFGHLSMLTVFVVRLKMCFANSIFGYSNKLMRSIIFLFIYLFIY